MADLGKRVYGLVTIRTLHLLGETMPMPPKKLSVAQIPGYCKEVHGITITRQTANNWIKYGKHGEKLQIHQPTQAYGMTPSISVLSTHVDDYLNRIGLLGKHDS
jgi:hypothetical protein